MLADAPLPLEKGIHVQIEVTKQKPSQRYHEGLLVHVRLAVNVI